MRSAIFSEVRFGSRDLTLCWLLLTAVFSGSSPVSAHDVITTKLTFTRDISRIFLAHCSACHGATASIPLTTYEQVRPWAVSIKEQVLSRSMPPWGAVKGFGEFSPDYGLSQEDILIIAAWVVGGAPAGDSKLLPKGHAPKAAEFSAVQDALTVNTRERLGKALRVVGIQPRPSSVVTSSKILARLPDGRIEPLVWLYQFDPKYKQRFRFRQPLDLPRGTLVESSTPLRFVLETAAAASRKESEQAP